jgi:hypothetical protein
MGTVIADALHHALQQPLGAGVAEVTEAQAVQLRDRTCAHGENVAVDPAHARCRSLVRLNGRRVVVALNFEGASQAVTDVDDPCVFLAGFHQHVWPFFGKGFEPLDGVLVRAVLAPHDRVHAHLCEVGRAAQDGFDLLKLLRTEAHVLSLFEGGWGNGSLHESWTVGVRSSSESAPKNTASPRATRPLADPFYPSFPRHVPNVGEPVVTLRHASGDSACESGRSPH